MRRHESGIGCGACGRGMNVPPAPGQGRTPPGHTRVHREELADGVDPKGIVPGESLPESADRTP
jgi:hypothetical protein